MQPDDVHQLLPQASAALRPLLLAAAWRVARAGLDRWGGEDGLAERFPFLHDHALAFAALDDELQPRHEPLAELIEAAGAPDWPTITTELWLLLGLVEEDARFAAVFEALDEDRQSGLPSQALMQSWWGSLPGEGLRPALRALSGLGLIKPVGGAGLRSEQLFEVEEACWAALRGEAWPRPAPGLRLHAPGGAPRLSELVLDGSTSAWLDGPAQAQLDEGVCLIVRGAEHNGRGSLLAALTASEGRPVLSIQIGGDEARPPPWLGAFCTLAQARPVFRLQATPGEALRLPALPGYRGWVGVVCAAEDAIDGLDALHRSVHTLQLGLPTLAQRRSLIARHGAAPAAGQAQALAARLHLASGHLVRALRSGAADEAGLREAALAGGSAALSRLAQRLTPGGAEAEGLVLDDALRQDLDALAARCQQRDQLRHALPAAFAARLNAGVRALLAGPSGTGKTLAAQVLARRLGLPIYRLDLGAVVSKYIGETERNLHQLLSAAQALDVMLLLDEGDALLAPRTDVGSSNDRYANLETNFLLQRLESHQGLVLVTTNAIQRIDTAFMRRFDLIVHFRPPEMAERLALWRAHLPATHALSDGVLYQVAEACALAGGQVRNVVLDAASAALARDPQGGMALDAGLLLAALQREYRRSGQLCPISAWDGAR